MTDIPRDPWALLSSRTPARIAIGRCGASLPTREVLSFALAPAKARDAVHARLDRAAMAARLQGLGLATIEVESQAVDRATYLRRPDFGRRLDTAARDRIMTMPETRQCDCALVIADGLSATAVAANAPKLVECLLPHLGRLGITLGPVAIATGARVALGDEVGQLLGARLVVVLIGERPGLSSADSLSAYVTYAPRPGRTDAERNCISNIRPAGLAPDVASASLAWIIEAALSSQATGITLKDRSGALAGTEQARAIDRSEI